ncbi:hypothetical protein COV18_05595 [Candidatus Woesearchaeota archaeon CG10_big_fil_rev_8_21_14_0_10_37_12]|nr:MAG: hypothetical protein COV18_05595 [Candidatus Woesearchaeota archaeon CG10_big_fil_rev_8_21_14_0_10_37_12]
MMRRTTLLVFVYLFLFLAAACTNTNINANNAPSNNQDAQIIEIGLDKSGYTPKEINVEVNKPVTLKDGGSLQGCAKYLVQPELGINANFAKNKEYQFTPTKKGTFDITCSMGMFKGKLIVA